MAETGCQGACPGLKPELDPETSMLRGQLRVLVDQAAQLQAQRRFEEAWLHQERYPLGTPWETGESQRRSLTVHDPIQDPWDGPIPDHPGDLALFESEWLVDRGPRDIDAPRVTEVGFPQLDALGLQAPDLPLTGPPPEREPRRIREPLIAERAALPLDMVCPKPEQGFFDDVIQAPLPVASAAPNEPHLVYSPLEPPQPILIVLLHGAGGDRGTSNPSRRPSCGLAFGSSP